MTEKTSDHNYHIDRFPGDGVMGSSFTLSFSPILMDFIFIRKTVPMPSDRPTPINFNLTAAGTTEATTSGAGNRTLTLGSNVVVPADRTLYVGYWHHASGYDTSLSAQRVSEQYDLQGDSESVTVKEKILTIETDTDSHFTTNVSGTAVTTLASKTDQENITNMPYNKFKILGVKMARGRDNAATNWVDWRLWFAKQDDFYAAKNDPDLDDMWDFIDFASCEICSLGSTAEEANEITNYALWPPRNTEIYAGAVGGGHPISSYQSPWPIYYEDEDGTNELHLMLENKSDVSHEAGVDKIKFWFKIEPVR